LANWKLIRKVRQNALLQEMKKFIDEQIAAGSDNEFPTMYQNDAMGEDISDVSGLFRSQ
jgi:hypothetical protein